MSPARREAKTQNSRRRKAASSASSKSRSANTAARKVAKPPRPGPPDVAELLGRAESLLKLARNLDAEIYLERGATVGAELERSGLGPAQANQEQGGAWRVVEAGRLGFAYFSHERHAARALDDARKAARHSSKKDFEFPASRKPKTVRGRWHEDVAQLDPETAVATALEVCKAARDCDKLVQVSAGGMSLAWEQRAIANTSGVSLSDQATAAQAAVSVIVPQGATSISDGEFVVRPSLKEDWAELGTIAAERALSLRKPKAPGPAGQRDVILHPDAVSQMVVSLASGAIHGDDALRGRSFWSGKLGQDVAHPGLSLVDDPFAAGPNHGAPFDDEGIACSARPLIKDGRLSSFIFSAWDGNLHNQKPTGHGFRGNWKGRPATSSNRLVLSTKSPKPLAKMLAGVDDGYLVQSVLGAHTANDTTGDFSVTAPSVWRIRNGALAGPCTEIALGGNLAQILQRPCVTSKEVQHQGGAIVPHMLLPGIQVSS